MTASATTTQRLLASAPQSVFRRLNFSDHMKNRHPRIRQALWRKSRHRRPKKNSAQHKVELRRFQEQVDIVVAQLNSLRFALSAKKTVYMPVHLTGYNSGTYPGWNRINICSTPVEPAKSVRYLGVTFQRNGQWTLHIQQATLNIQRALNLVRAIRKEPWGQHRETLIPIVQSLVRTRLLFAAPVLHDLPRQKLLCMVRVECQALRVALGFPKSVPHEQVYNEAGILPLWAWIRRDACRYLSGSVRVPNSTDEELCEGWISAPHGKPTQGLPEVKTDIRGLGKKAAPHLLIARTRELLAKEFAEDFRVYTDGLVMEDSRTGAGVYLEPTGEAIAGKITPTTILTAELLAIQEALREIIALPHPPPRVTILMESRSSLELLLSGYCASRPELSAEVLRLSTEIAKLSTSLLFQWVPAHVGLEGNEKADKVAKRGALGYEDSAMLVPPSTGDAYKKIDAAAWELWREEYVNIAASRGCPTTTGTEPTHKILPALPPHTLAMASRIRVNHWRAQHTDTTCTCGKELVFFNLCLFICSALGHHFQHPRDLLGDPTTALHRLWGGSNMDAGQGHLALAAKLTCSSPVGSLFHPGNDEKNYRPSPPAITSYSIIRLEVKSDSHPDILDDILHRSVEADRLGVRLRFQWVPSHVGLHDNEMADKAAKHGALAPEEEEIPV
ncbi:uncharacterized protein LOC143034245 [Oratosquilla oratoria]|uniref:uncharacterized protein LOC143034245 n=1 Tax=Oratosquilla oratoria TaxID=337810 RepID=UPI003F768557